MKAYADLDEYVAAQTPKNRATIRGLRNFVRRPEPKLSEAVEWRFGCWIGAKGPVAYENSDTQYVQFGFSCGSSLEDPRALLEGKGKYVRHIRVRSRAAIDEPHHSCLPCG